LKNQVGLRDEPPVELQDRRRKGRLGAGRQHGRDCPDAAAFRLGKSGDVGVVRARVFERESHEFAASLDLRPVVELVPFPAMLPHERAR
jgi:hypothetical protein